MHITGAMRKANIGDNPELLFRKVAPALEVVTHSGLNRKLSFFFPCFLGHFRNDITIPEQLHNHLACDASRFAAILVCAQLNSCTAKVMPGNLIDYFAFRSLRNYTQAQNIVLLGDGGNRKLDKINALVTKFTGDVAIQLKYPPGYDGAEGVAEHPNGTKGNAHHIMFGGDLTAKHNKIIETEMVRILSIVVLPQ